MLPSHSLELRVASFFTGIGGLDLGFERTEECRVVFQCEIDPFCRRVLRTHWPDALLLEDINTLQHTDIPEADIWCAGFPCQDLSLANQGKRRGLKGDRSGLFGKFAELAATALPKWIVLENVPGLLSSGNGQDFRYVLEALDDLGYFVAWRVLDAKYFGTPQHRRRVFIVASYQADSAARVLFGASIPGEMVGSSATQVSSPSCAPESCDREADLFTIQHATIGRKPAAGPQGKGYRNDGKSYTLDSRGSSNVVCTPDDGFGVRDSSRFPGELDSRRLRVIGNAVCVYVAEWIASRLVNVEAQNRLKCFEHREAISSDRLIFQPAD